MTTFLGSHTVRRNALSTLFGLALAGGALALSASEPPKAAKASQTTPGTPAPRIGKSPRPKAATSDRKRDARVVVVTTGTRIPQQVTRLGHTTDGMQSIVIFDFDEYSRSGQGRLTEFLRRQPMFR